MSCPVFARVATCNEGYEGDKSVPLYIADYDLNEGILWYVV